MSTMSSYVDLGLEALTAPRVVMVSTGAIESKPATAWGWVVGSLAAVFGMVGVAAALKEEADLENLPARELQYLTESETEFRRGRRAAFEGRKVKPIKDEVMARYLASEKERYARALDRKAKREFDARVRKTAEIAEKKAAAAEIGNLIAAGVSQREAERAAREMSAEAVQTYIAERERLAAVLEAARKNAEDPALAEGIRAQWAAKAKSTQGALKGLLRQAAKTKRAGTYQEYEDPGVDAQIRELLLKSEQAKLEGSVRASELRIEAQRLPKSATDPAMDARRQELLRRADAAEAEAGKHANRLRSESMKLALPYLESAQRTAMGVITASAGKFTEEGERLVREELATEAAQEALYALVAPEVLEPVGVKGTLQRPTKEAAACFKKGRVGRAIVAEAAARASYKGKNMTRHKGMASGSQQIPFEQAEPAVEEVLQFSSPGQGLAEGAFDLEAVLEKRRAPWTAAFKRAVAKAKRDATEDLQQEYENMLRYAEASEKRLDLAAAAATLQKDVMAARLGVELCARKQLTGAEVAKKGTVFGGAITNVQLAQETGLAEDAVARLLRCGQRYLSVTASEAPQVVAAYEAAVEQAAEDEMTAKRKARVPREYGTVCERQVAQRALPLHQRETPLAIRAPLLAKMMREGKLKAERPEPPMVSEKVRGKARKLAAQAHEERLRMGELRDAAILESREELLRRHPPSTPMGQFLRGTPS